MQLTDHKLTIGTYSESVPKLSVDATVHAWSVPTAYRESGYFVSVQRAGDPMEAPACDGREIEYLGAVELAADEEAKTATELAEARAAKLSEIRSGCDAALDPLAVSYPEREVQSWPQQVAEATALENDAAASAPLIRQMAAARSSLGDTLDARVAELAARIRQNAADWSAVAGPIIGRRQALEDQVSAVTTIEEVAAIVVDFTGGAL